MEMGKIKYVPLTGIEHRLLGRQAHSLITILTELSHAFLSKSVGFNRGEGNDISIEYQITKSVTLKNMLCSTVFHSCDIKIHSLVFAQI
jgi:hypothetical protein